MDLIRQLADVVLHADICIQGEHGKAPSVLVFGCPLTRIRPIREGDHRRAVFRHVDHMVQDRLRGIGLRSLQEVGQGIVMPPMRTGERRCGYATLMSFLLYLSVTVSGIETIRGIQNMYPGRVHPSV